MAKFLQKTVEEMALESSLSSKQQAPRATADFMGRVRDENRPATSEEIKAYAKFENELTLGHLGSSCRRCALLMIPSIGNATILRHQLHPAPPRDDVAIEREGVQSLRVCGLPLVRPVVWPTVPRCCSDQSSSRLPGARDARRRPVASGARAAASSGSACTSR